MTPTVFAAQNNSDAVNLLNQLQNSQTSSQALIDLTKLGNADASAREYIARTLPDLVALGPKATSPGTAVTADQVWVNEVSLVDNLKIKEALPALSKCIEYELPGNATSTYGTRSSFTSKPAGKALIDMGDLSVPVLSHELKSADAQHRASVTLILSAIGTPAARSALRAAADVESDPTLAQEMRKAGAKH
jgi:hypothetical protein